jgi:hypothetical protein
LHIDLKLDGNITEDSTERYIIGLTEEELILMVLIGEDTGDTEEVHGEDTGDIEEVHGEDIGDIEEVHGEDIIILEE